MKSAVIVFPASNCDRDMAVALRKASGHAPLMVWHREGSLPADLDLIALPGGFSYGDYLRCGAMAAHSPIMQDVIAAAKRGVRILGVCNGFQILVEAGLLDGALMRNQHLKFICRKTPIKVTSSASIFTSKYANEQTLTIPIAHHDGNYFAYPDTLKALNDNGQIAFTYDSDNPNGSAQNIAGIFNKNRTILGMMPHPERAIDAIHGSTDGLGLFTSLVENLA
jgi:phosphoribosylformylglycinamidine synthase